MSGLGPMPTDVLTGSDGMLTQSWHTWINNLKNLINFGNPPSADTGITAIGGVPLTNDYMRIQSATAGPITISSNPQISKGFDGQKILIEGLSATKTVEFIDGNGLKLAGAASFIFADSDSMILHFNEAKNLWIEDSRSKK